MKRFLHHLAAALVTLLEPLYVLLTNHLARTGLLSTLILDQQLIFDGNQNTAGVLSGVALTSQTVSTNIIDLLNARDLGEGLDGHPPRLLVLMMTAAQSAGATTLVITLDGSTDSTTWVSYIATPSIAKATLAAGAQVMNVALPGVLPSSGPNPRYLRLGYTIGTGPYTAGTIFSAIVLGRDDASNAYPPGVVVAN